MRLVKFAPSNDYSKQSKTIWHKNQSMQSNNKKKIDARTLGDIYDSLNVEDSSYGERNERYSREIPERGDGGSPENAKKITL